MTKYKPSRIYWNRDINNPKFYKACEVCGRLVSDEPVSHLAKAQDLPARCPECEAEQDKRIETYFKEMRT